MRRKGKIPCCWRMSTVIRGSGGGESGGREAVEEEREDVEEEREAVEEERVGEEEERGELMPFVSEFAMKTARARVSSKCLVNQRNYNKIIIKTLFFSSPLLFPFSRSPSLSFLSRFPFYCT